MQPPPAGIYFGHVPPNADGATITGDLCPDCPATGTLTHLGDGIWTLAVGHAPTCPTWQAMKDARQE